LVVEVARVVDAVFVGDGGVGEGAEFDQATPVRGVAREPADFQAEDDAGVAEADFGDEALEALAVAGAGTRLPLIAIDHGDQLGMPAEADGALLECVLAGARFGVAQDLPQGGLADVDEGAAREVRRGDLAGGAAAGGRSLLPGFAAAGVVEGVHALTRTLVAAARAVVSSTPRSNCATSLTIASASTGTLPAPQEAIGNEAPAAAPHAPSIVWSPGFGRLR